MKEVEDMNAAVLTRSGEGTRFENGFRAEISPVRVLDLHGTWYGMGRQYGFLLIGYAGEIYAVNGFNEAGLFLELNNGTPSTGMPADMHRVCGTTGLFETLFRADSLDGLDSFFQAILCDDSYIINAADAREARSYEWSQIGVKRADQYTPEGLLASTNHYVHPDWPWPVPDDARSWNSITRREHLLNLAEANKGQITAERMCELLDLNLADGGVTDELTVYQMVVEPENMKLRLKITGACDWTLIDLGSFLRE